MNSRLRGYYQCPAPEGIPEAFLLTGRALVIFDGLDELIDTSRRRELTDRIELFAALYPLSRIFITSRRVGYSEAQLNPRAFTVYQLDGLNRKDVADYVQRWFSTIEEMDSGQATSISGAFIQESESVTDLASNPLMLSLMCIIYRGQTFIPRNRPEVYERCATLLFDKWDSSRKIHVELKAAAYIDPAIKHLAYWMLTDASDREGFLESELVREAARYLEPVFEEPHEARRAAEEFVRFCRGRAWVLSDAGTTGDGETLFKFTHRTFMEYFAAYELTRISRGPEDLAKRLAGHVARAEWDMVGQLAIQISNKSFKAGAERALRTLMNDKRKRTVHNRDEVLAFVARCLGFLHVPPALAREVAFSVVRSTEDLIKVEKLAAETRVPSIGQLACIVPELRPVVAAVLGDEVQRLGRDSDQLRRLLAATLISGYRDMMPNQKSEGVEDYWRDWSRRYLGDHGYSVLLPNDISALGAWVNAGAYRIIPENEMYKLLLTSECPLTNVFSEAHEPILGHRYVAVAGLLEVGGTIDFHDLGEFARVVFSLPEPPWVELVSRTDRRLFDSDLRADVKGLSRDEAWAAIVLMMVIVELAVEWQLFTQASPMFHELLNARESGESPSAHLEEAVASQPAARRRFFQRWLAREISLVRSAKSATEVQPC